MKKRGRFLQPPFESSSTGKPGFAQQVDEQTCLISFMPHMHIPSNSFTPVPDLLPPPLFSIGTPSWRSSLPSLGRRLRLRGNRGGVSAHLKPYWYYMTCHVFGTHPWINIATKTKLTSQPAHSSKPKERMATKSLCRTLKDVVLELTRRPSRLGRPTKSSCIWHP